MISGVTVVTTLVCFSFFRTRGCGCIGHPAFPAPSVFLGELFCKTRAHRAAGLRTHTYAIARNDFSALAQRATASAEARRAKAEGGSDEAIQTSSFPDGSRYGISATCIAT